ncbi:hypothetical protein Trydic_g5597 [Trypoxylus dichotomus]
MLNINASRAPLTVILFLLSGASVMFNEVSCLTVFGKLQPITNDCYERLAVGQRLDKKDVYQEADLKTVKRCEMECTRDKEKCRSFSFGIGVKGNASCQLSSHVVKETVDLKPVGTIDDTDFDLYIKKMGCKLVIDTHPSLNDEPEDPDKPKSRPRPDHYKKHHGFHYGAEHHQSSFNSESHWSMKDIYKGNRPSGDNDKAVSYNTYDRPTSYDEPSKSDYEDDRAGSYDNSDKFSFTNPFDDIDAPTYYKPSSEDEKRYGSNYDKPSSNYESRPTSGYGSTHNKPSSNYDKRPFPEYGAGQSSSKPEYGSNPKPPFRPAHLDNPYNNQNDHYPGKPHRPSYYPDPDNPNYESPRPTRPSYDEDDLGYGHGKPHKPPKLEDSEGYNYKRPSNGYNYNKPSRPDEFNGYHYPKPTKPTYGGNVKPVIEAEDDRYEYPKRPHFPGGFYGESRPPKPNGPYESQYIALPETYSPNYPYQSPVIKDHVDPYGHLITSVVAEIRNVCFRRALAGKRVSRIFVRKAVSCERMEHCQQECAEEKRFICEGFNYRLDPSGHGRGDCELLDVPYIRLDLRRDIISNPDYDYYEKDRNCKEHQEPPPFRPSAGEDNLPGPVRPPLHDWQFTDYFDHYSSRDRFRDRYDEHATYDRRGSGYDLRPPLPATRPYNRRSDYFEESYSSGSKYEDRHNGYDYGYHYSIPSSSFGKDYDYKSHESYLPPRDRYDHTNYWIKNKYYVKPYYDKATGGNKWGVYGGNYGDFGNKGNTAPPRPPKHWGEYGGTYGVGGGDYYQTNDYWGLNKVNEHKFVSNSINYDVPLPPYKPTLEHLPPTIPSNPGYLPSLNNYGTGYGYRKPVVLGESDPGYPKQPSFTFVNECSLRSATGYRLYKSIVKKVITVPNIYDCEYACFKEKEFLCTSYAFRYVIGADVPPNNCYLSNKNYKELDYYTDLEQDRNFDIYTMSNRDRCNGGSPHHRDSSECFLHVRSGQRFHDKCVKDSFTVKSIVECELACLRSQRFICRTFSFRYGSPVIGGVADNCQLTDIPFHELDPQQDLVFDPGFVTYERASFGYGCELNQLPNLHKPKPTITSLSDDICYIGFGWSAKLLPQAVKRVVKVHSESECKAECTRTRMETPFCCITFSYKSTGHKDEPNCFLSDIFQRDLLENIDYVRDPDYWLFSWDNANPQCNFPGYYEQRLPFDERYDFLPGSLTWRVYSVGGWPCKRGSSCRQSELGFWFCELEGGSPSAWDYCCRPKHQCGYSEGFPYQWCYVGPSSTQWRKCNDKYYPYLPSPRPPEHYIPIKPSKPTLPNYIPSKPITPDYGSEPPSTTFIPPPTIHIEPPKKTYLPPAIDQPRPWITTGKPLQSGLQPPFRPGFRPDRPQSPPLPYKPTPSLDEYEEQFDHFFLDPPKPGGFGQARYWPVSYLHKEMPPNASSALEQKFGRMSMDDDVTVKPRFQAIQNLIDVINANDLNNIKYEISNTSSRADDVLHVQIPLLSEFSENIGRKKGEHRLINQPIDIVPPNQAFGNVTETRVNKDDRNLNTAEQAAKERHISNRSTYRKGFIEKANLTDGKPVTFLSNI